MPLYEYKCSQCDHLFELLLRNSDETPGTCPKCGSRHVEKLMSAFAVGATQPSYPKSKCGSCAQAGSCPYQDD